MFVLTVAIILGGHRPPLQLRGWWNWQTRTLEGRMAKAVQVQVLSRAPFLEFSIYQRNRSTGCRIRATLEGERLGLMRGWMLVSLAVVVGVLGDGCASKPDAKRATAEPQPAMRALGQPVAPPTHTTEPDEGSDNSIGLEVRRLLDLDPISNAGIVVEVDDGKVTLRGSAPNFAAASRAEGLAHSVKGVKSVVNQVMVKTPAVMP